MAHDSAARELALYALEEVVLLTAGTARTGQPPPGADARVRRAQALIAADPAAPHTERTLAGQVALSPSRFARLFTRQAGQSPVRAVREARLLHAARLGPGRWSTDRHMLIAVHALRKNRIGLFSVPGLCEGVPRSPVCSALHQSRARSVPLGVDLQCRIALRRNAAVHDAGLSISPGDARLFDVTDAQLSAELKKWSGASPALHPVGELLDRHWEAGFAYARLCTADARSAGMLTTAAFTRLFGETLRQTGPTAAWRPQLLVTVRRIAAEWDTDHRSELLRPELRSAVDGAERVAARLLPPASRRLLTGAFPRLPQSARCVLWHIEVEAEPLAVPAGLLGLGNESARLALGRARERLREECLQVHRELAPERECGQYLRMLDVTYRRGGADIDPDLREHLERCGYCRDTAGQLTFFNDGLGAALAEAVLGWAAWAYLEARARHAEEPAEGDPAAVPIAGESFFADDAAFALPGAAPAPAAEAFGPGIGPLAPGGEAAAPADWPAAPAGDPLAPADRPAAPAGDPFAPVGEDVSLAGTGPRTGRRAARRARRAEPTLDSGPAPAASPAPPAQRAATGSGRAALKAVRRAARRRNVTGAVATVSALVLLPLVLWSMDGSGDSTVPAAEDRPVGTPGSAAGSSTGNPSWAGAAEAAKGELRGRLHNLGSGLCVGIVGGKAVTGAETVLTACSSAVGQQWSYETDGLVRSGANPDLCLDSHLGHSVRLAPCTGGRDSGTKNVRYDFTLQGTLVPRLDQDLALSPAATDGSGALVVKTREDDSEVQHWVFDTSKKELQSEVANWDSVDGRAKKATPSPAATREPSGTPTPTPQPSASASASQPAPTVPAPDDAGCYPDSYSCSGDGQNDPFDGEPGGPGGQGPGGDGP